MTLVNEKSPELSEAERKDIAAAVGLVNLAQRQGLDGHVPVAIELLREVQSLSNKVRQDWEDEVRKGPNDPYDLYSFTAYVDRRRQTLLALRTPLPPTPGTTGTNAS